jgi:hypothetical protein
MGAMHRLAAQRGLAPSRSSHGALEPDRHDIEIPEEPEEIAQGRFAPGGIEHSARGAFNAVSQYVDWERPTRGGNGRAGDERRFQSALLGPGAELKRRAFALAASMAAGGR